MRDVNSRKSSSLSLRLGGTHEKSYICNTGMAKALNWKRERREGLIGKGKRS
jgi:hypothetical protein